MLVRIDARAAEQNAAAERGAGACRPGGAGRGRAGVRAPTAAVRARATSARRRSTAPMPSSRRPRRGAALRAKAGAARTQSGFYVVKAPYGGVVAGVPVVLGDMALPGRPLLTLYDPARCASPPPSRRPPWPVGREVRRRAEIPGARPALGRAAPCAAAAHRRRRHADVQLRLDLPADTTAVPGMFARAWLPARRAQAAARPGCSCLSQALVRRSELRPCT